MLLFQKRFHASLLDGSVTLTFRRWDKPHVRAGGRYRCHPIGVLEVERVERVGVASLSEEDAMQSGFASRAELVAYLATAREAPLEAEVFRIQLHHGGDGDRVALALQSKLGPDEVRAITERLARLDAKEPWTRRTLAIIAEHPRTAASQLAAKLGRETLTFKADVRKLKKLGLTQSFEVGYEVSPRGQAWLAARPRRR